MTKTIREWLIDHVGYAFGTELTEEQHNQMIAALSTEKAREILNIPIISYSGEE